MEPLRRAREELWSEARGAAARGAGCYDPTVARALLIDDDRLVATTLQIGLACRGFDLVLASTGVGGLRSFEGGDFDLVLVDVGLPDLNGYEVCRRLRDRDPEVPLLILTARHDERSAVSGFESGADDYLRKPCGLDEMSSRMSRLLHRRAEPSDRHRVGALSLSPRERKAWVGGTELPLGPKEFDLLAALVGRPGAVLQRDTAAALLEPDGDVCDRTVDSHVSHLRRKLRAAGLDGVRIAAVYGIGYRLEHA